MNISELQSSRESYLAVRDALGFMNRAAKILLPDFVQFVAAQGLAGPIRTQAALDWACHGSSTRGVAGQASRLSLVRGFLTFLRANFPETEVPGDRLLASPRRPQPYIFSQAEISKLMEAAAQLGPRGSLRPYTYQTLIGLLASTGLRIGEALRLKITDLCLEYDPLHLRILQTKFHKSRLVPLHPTTAANLRLYAQRVLSSAMRVCQMPSLSLNEEPTSSTFLLQRWLARMAPQLEWRPTDERLRPSWHSLRHTFAVRRLTTWCQAGADVQSLAPYLSIYLGYVSPEESYLYLSATPELLGAAAESFQRYALKGGAS
jgi:integrase/recombinase XerD